VNNNWEPRAEIAFGSYLSYNVFMENEKENKTNGLSPTLGWTGKYSCYKANKEMKVNVNMSSILYNK